MVMTAATVYHELRETHISCSPFLQFESLLREPFYVILWIFWKDVDWPKSTLINFYSGIIFLFDDFPLDNLCPGYGWIKGEPAQKNTPTHKLVCTSSTSKSWLDWPGIKRTLQYMRRHCSSRRKPRWHLQVDREGCLDRRASCLSRHSAATCCPSGDTAASAAHSSNPRYNASQRGSVEQTRWASTQSAEEGGKLKECSTPKRRQMELRQTC